MGITPVYSLIKNILYSLPDAEVLLYYSNSNKETAVFYNELLQLEEIFKGRLHIEWLFSNAKNLNRARLNKEVLPQWLSPFLTYRANPLFYTCGPYDYMRMVTYGLEEMGFIQEIIRREIFDTSRPVLKSLPPDTEAHLVTIHQQEKGQGVLVKYPQTILQTARKQGITLPYSCETGKCGACVAQCTHGKVWMSYNEVLTDKELASGKILTCTGYPVDGDVVLEIS